MMGEFGKVLVGLGRKVLDTQAQALAKSSFIKGPTGRSRFPGWTNQK